MQRSNDPRWPYTAWKMTALTFVAGAVLGVPAANMIALEPPPSGGGGGTGTNFDPPPSGGGGSTGTNFDPPPSGGGGGSGN